MKFTIKNLRHVAEDFLGDNTIRFYFDVHITEPEDYVIENYFFHYYSLIKYLEKVDPKLNNYLKKIRKDIGGWGPKEAQIFEAMEPAVLDEIYKHTKECLLQRDWQPLYDREMQWKSNSIETKIEEQKKREEYLNDFEKNKLQISQAQLKFYQFAETVEKQIQATAVEIYPELLEGTAEQINKFRYLFSNDIISMYEGLSKHLTSLRKQE